MGKIRIKKIADFLIKDGMPIIDTNIYIVSENKSAILIDCGGGGDKAIEYILENDLDLKYIVLTHSHFDHIYELDKIKEKFPKALVVASHNSSINDPKINMLSELGEENRKSKIDIYVKDKDTLYLEGNENVFSDKEIKETLEIKNGEMRANLSKDKHAQFEIIETPGHTFDSICLFMTYGEKHYMFSGDTIFEGSIGRTDFYGGSDEVMVDTLRKLKRNVPEDTLVFPGHGDNTYFRDWKKVFRMI